MRAVLPTLTLLAIFIMSAAAAAPQALAQLRQGDILVTDQAAGMDGLGALFRVNPSTGNRTLLNDFGDSSQGDLGFAPSGAVIVASGNILVINRDAGTDFRGALFSINPSNGNRTVLSDFNDSSQGDLGVNPVGVAIGASGDILVIDQDAGTDDRGLLFSINPSDGNRTVLSDFADLSQGSLGDDPFGVAIGASGNILIIDQDGGTDNKGSLFSINPSDGNRTVLSDFGDSSQGSLGSDPFGVAQGTPGNILVIDLGVGALFRVSSSTGDRVIISDFGNSDQGELGVVPIGISTVVSCNGILATRVGTLGVDNITGTPGRDIIHGLGSSDTVNALGGNDLVCGGSGSDRLSGGMGADTILAGPGNDTVSGGNGNDRLNGNQGNDRLNGGQGADTCNGGFGTDSASGCETVIGVP